MKKFLISSLLQGVNIKDFLSKNILLFGSAIFIYTAIFAGRFSIQRIFSSIYLKWIILGEVRLWAILISTVIVLIGLRKYQKNNDNTVHVKTVWLSISLIVVAQLVLMLHAFFYSPSDYFAYFAWELVTIILVASILGLSFQVWGVKLVHAIMWIALVFALFIAVWMLMVTVAVNGAENLNPLATTYTYYRVQMFGGFAGIGLLFGSRHFLGKVVLGFCAVICFAAGYMTLSKAALLAGVVSTLLLAVIYVTWFSKIRASIVLCISASAAILFVVFVGGNFAARSAQGLLGTGYALNTSGVVPPRPEKDGDLNIVRFEAQKRLAEVVACTAEKYPCAFMVERWEQDIVDSMLRYRVYIPDFSFRIRLLIEGIRGSAKAPWLGNGFGTFSAVATNLYTKEPDYYSYPHNIIVELLYSVGALGLIFIFGMTVFLMVIFLRAKEVAQTGMPIYTFVVSVCIGSLFGGDYIDFRVVWIGLLFCIMLLQKAETTLS
jgi:hypothetical protein